MGQKRKNPTVLSPTIPRSRMGITLAFSSQSSHMCPLPIFIFLYPWVTVTTSLSPHSPAMANPVYEIQWMFRSRNWRNLRLDVREKMRETQSSQAAGILESGEELDVLIFSRQAAQHLQHITESYLKIPRGVLYALMTSPLILYSGFLIKMFAHLAQLTIWMEVVILPHIKKGCNHWAC